MINKLILKDNKYCKLETIDKTFLDKLRKKFSYRMEGYEYSPAYKNFGWNGITYIINKQNEFPIGLLTSFKEFAEEYNFIYDIEDKRINNFSFTELDISKKLEELKLIPRDYQLNAVDQCVKNDRGIIRAATGAGKSLITALIAAKFNEPTIIYVISLDLLGQFYKLFCEIFGEDQVGYIGNGICNPKRITISTIWSIARSLDLKGKVISDDEFSDDKEKFDESKKEKIHKCLKEAKVHLLDECHVSACNTIATIYKAINPYKLYGLSGTPWRDDGSDILIEGILGRKIIDITAGELIKKNVLVQPLIKFIKVPPIYTQSSNYQSIYKDYIVENNVRNNLIINNCKKLVDKKYQVLILFKNIPHGKALEELAIENNLNYAFLSGTDKLERREEVKEKLLNKELDVLIASTIIDIGVDIKTLSALILAGGGKSSIKALQRIGRVIRSAPDKKQAAIIDFKDDIRYLNNHSKIRQEIYESEPGFKVFPA